jgi:hypothetical protein
MKMMLGFSGNTDPWPNEREARIRRAVLFISGSQSIYTYGEKEIMKIRRLTLVSFAIFPN